MKYEYTITVGQNEEYDLPIIMDLELVIEEPERYSYIEITEIEIDKDELIAHYGNDLHRKKVMERFFKIYWSQLYDELNDPNNLYHDMIKVDLLEEREEILCGI